MRLSLVVSAAFAALVSLQGASGQCANSQAQCPSVQAVVPTPWFNLDFSTDPRLNPAVGGIANAGYSWLETAPGDSCAAFHQGMAQFRGSTNGSDNLGPHIDLMAASGPYSAGTALPGLIGGAGSGDIAQGTRGWSFEVTVRADAEGNRNNWAKFVNLGTSARLRTGTCNGEWLVGWQSNSDAISMSTCVTGSEHKIDNFVSSTPDNTWIHIVSVIQYSATVATYFVYYNGNLISNARYQSQQLNEIVRDRAYLARSSWNDAYFNGTVDTFAIYDIALTQTQVKGLYGEKMNGCTVTRQPYANMTAATDAVTPVFDAAFTQNITTAPSVPADFSWLQQDPEDVPCGVNTQHQGLLSLAGDADWTPSFSSGPFVNLSSTGGENYIGQTVPVFGNVTAGQGNTTARTAGSSIEIMFKASFQNPSAKIFDAGNGAVNGQCVPGDIWAGWRGSDYSIEIKWCDTPNNYRTIVDGNIAIQLRTWYHLVITFVAQPDGTTLIVVYLNGLPSVSLQNQPMLPQIYRQNVLLGRSQFFGSTDTYFSGLIDRFAVYNRALSSAQVATLATNAGIRSCPQSDNTLSTINPSSVFYRLTFDSDPRPAGAQYNWMSVDTNDTAADQALHRGLIVLGYNGGRNTNQWVNLSSTTGPNSLANTPAVPQFGGEGNGVFNEGTKGWTWEAVFKIFPTPDTQFDAATKNITTANGQSWAKLFDFGDGNKGSNRDQCENDVIFGFNSGDNWMKFESCNTVARDLSVGDTARRQMKINTWYHVVATMQLTPNGAQASYYLNGELIETKLLSTYPLYASRIDARIGDSSWANDPFFNGALDMFTIYSQSVNQRQVNAMYAAVNTVGSSSSAAPAVSSSSATGSNTAQSSAGTAQRSSSSSVTSAQSTGAAQSSSTSATQSSSGAAQSSAGGVTSSSSSSSAVISSSAAPVPVYPTGTVRVAMNAVLPTAVNSGNFAQIKSALEADITQNLANATGVAASSLNGLVQVESIGGVTSGARRLLQTQTPVVFVILGTVSDVITNLGVDASQVATTVANTLSTRINNGQFTTTNSGATVPTDQQVTVAPADADSSTGDNNDDVNAAASFGQSFALTVLCAIIAMMAL